MSDTTTTYVIVSWNVHDQLRACLTSLDRERNTGASFNACVIDNNSADSSVAMVRREFPWVQLIALTKNIGFGAACNMGVRQSVGNYVVLLNPDAEVMPGFTSKINSTFAIHPPAAVIGGSILAADGRRQASIRGFPTLWSSSLDAMKILRRCPWLAPGYLKPNFDYTEAQVAPQVMGACFVVRRDRWIELEGFDERFFAWFEEVDYCKRVSHAGYEVWYDPALQLVHSGGASFSQLTPLRRHRMFTRSLTWYARKHLGAVAAAFVWAASVAGYLPAFIAAMAAGLQASGYKTQFLMALAGLLTVDVISWHGWQAPALGSLVTVMVAVAWFIVAQRSLALAVVLLVVELIIGSQGYLLKLIIGDNALSLRLVLFVMAFAVVVWRAVTRHSLNIMQHTLRWWYLLALLAIVWATIVGVIRGQALHNLVLDVNGYLYLLIFPLFVEVYKDLSLNRWFKLLIPAAVVWLAIKTQFALYLFSHLPTEKLLTYYNWWRQTGFGEITYVTGNVFRIFSQSQVFAAVAAAALIALYVSRRPATWGLYLLLLACLSTLLASLSRSYWFGVAVAVATTMTLFAFTRPGWRMYLVKIGTMVLLALAASGIVLATTRLSWPLKPLAEGDARLFAERLRGEAASASRLRLLSPLWQATKQNLLTGSGFGATVQYYSLDPRIVRATAGGSGYVETSAFEWGYLDALLKFGLLGFSAFFGFVLALGIKLFRATPWLASGLLALLLLNITTPYLNHPLGLGALMLLAVIAPQLERKII